MAASSSPSQVKNLTPGAETDEEKEVTSIGTPLRYRSLDEVYSVTVPLCIDDDYYTKLYPPLNQLTDAGNEVVEKDRADSQLNRSEFRILPDSAPEKIFETSETNRLKSGCDSIQNKRSEMSKQPEAVSAPVVSFSNVYGRRSEKRKTCMDLADRSEADLDRRKAICADEKGGDNEGEKGIGRIESNRKRRMLRANAETKKPVEVICLDESDTDEEREKESESAGIRLSRMVSSQKRSSNWSYQVPNLEIGSSSSANVSTRLVEVISRMVSNRKRSSNRSYRVPNFEIGSSSSVNAGTKKPVEVICLDDDDDIDEERVKEGYSVGTGLGRMESNQKRRSNQSFQVPNWEIGSSSSVNASTRKLNSSDGILFKCSSVKKQTKEWTLLSYENADWNTFVGFQCKVYWPLDCTWYSGHVISYNSETGMHHVKYDDGDEETLLFPKQKIKFYISWEQMQELNLKQSIADKDNVGFDDDELLVLAASLDNYGYIASGDIVWAKVTGHAKWPAIVVNESDAGALEGLVPNHREISVPVQFFGTHDFAWIRMTQLISFFGGLQLSYHSKCSQPSFLRSLEEVKVYLTEHALPNKMLSLQHGIKVDDCDLVSGEDNKTDTSTEGFIGDKGTKATPDCRITCPFYIGYLRIINLGKIVTDSEYFHSEKFIWPEGYTAERKFISATDPSSESCYKMQVLRNPKLTSRPLFRVTMDSGEEFKGSTPSACWNKIYKRVSKIRGTTGSKSSAGYGLKMIHKSGSHMFGFSNPRVSKIIKELSNSKMSSMSSRKLKGLPDGYRPVHVDWKDLDKCHICHMHEEYEDNLFVQCDKCRMMVHSRCYGVLEPTEDVLWLCRLCCPEAPESPPLCCLCPVIGGAMKPTTDGRWAHLACALWIPETCFLDVKRMEPIDGLKKIRKDRWNLLCSICGVAYGACIQCSNSTCRVAYHPLCARAADICIELAGEDELHPASFDEYADEGNQCIHLLSFCKKHKQSSNEQMRSVVRHCSQYIPLSNPSGCARTEPHNLHQRRGRKEPEAVTTANFKRLYVENMPYRVTGYCQNGILQSSILPTGNTSKSVLSLFARYKYMKETVNRRLNFGKSVVHGFGVFTKHPHKAGDMVIEYTGEIVRHSIADRREHLVYDSLVGAGTYMFQIDNERVLDATRAGNIAHLINHSCEPNCYSRIVTVKGDDHIIIYAKRDIPIFEELSYDYRLSSTGEKLVCYCGASQCRGFVNSIQKEEQLAKLRFLRGESIDSRDGSRTKSAVNS